MVPSKKKRTEKSFQARLSESAGDPKALLELGKSCFLAERYEEAVKTYKEAISIESNKAAPFYNLGVAYQALGKHVKAKETFLKVLKIDPNHEAAQEALSSLTDY